MTHVPGREMLRQWIRRSQLTQREAARRIGMDQTQLSQILGGKRGPGVPNCVKIHAATGIPIQAWVPRQGDIPTADSTVTALTPNIGNV